MKRHRAGQLEAAAALYAEVLALAPRHADALHLSGLLAHQQGRHHDAIAAITQAIDGAPSVPDFRHSRGLAHRALGDLAAAQADFAKAAALNPNYLEAWINLGITQLQRDDPRSALAAFQRAAELAPDSAEAQGYLGTAHLRTGGLDGAIAALKRAVALDPHFAEAHYNVGIAHERRGDFAAAERAWRRSIEANPYYLKPWNNLGVLLHRQGRTAEARAGFERALSHAGPDGRDTAELWNNLGNVLDDLGAVEASLHAYERAAQLSPRDARLQVNLGSALLGIGRVDAAQAHFAKARELDPAYPAAAHCSLLALLFADDDPNTPLSDATAWARGLSAPPPAPHANSRDPGRRLRVGYVSPDFYSHAVANFIAPVLAAHDREAVDVFGYAEVRTPDAVTERLRGLVGGSERWRDTTGISDRELAAMVRADGIDILVDLAGHTVGSRLTMFALKPAPVQATWVGYPATTGLSQIDWRISDALADPPGAEDQYSEKLLRLPAGFNCYRPLAVAPDVGPLPADAAGHVTFGSFNHAAKIGARTLDLWAELLRRVADARLLLKHRGFACQAVRDACIAAFERRGVAAARLDLVNFIADPGGHLAAYHRVDVALDPFPYNGTTTTCEALWMGVPVVTLAGVTHRARAGASLLTRAGLPELIADTPAIYVDLAARLAADRDRLRTLRRGLRTQAAASDLCNAARVTGELEAAFRRVWRDWCRDAS